MSLFHKLFLAYFPRVPPAWQLAVLAFALLVFLLCVWRGARLSRCLALTALLSYCLLLLVMLVLARSARQESAVILAPFYSYRKIFAFTKGSFEWLCLDIFNCLLYLPLGLFYAAWRHISDKPPDRLPLYTAAFGFVLSLLIEILQYVLRRGVFEPDDLLHNTLGALLGALLWHGAVVILARCKRRFHP